MPHAAGPLRLSGPWVGPGLACAAGAASRSVSFDGTDRGSHLWRFRGRAYRASCLHWRRRLCLGDVDAFSDSILIPSWSSPAAGLFVGVAPIGDFVLRFASRL